VNQSGFGVLESSGDVSRESKVWVLVNRAWNETRDIALWSKDVRECIRERRCRLNGYKVGLSNVITGEGVNSLKGKKNLGKLPIIKSKRGLGDVQSNAL
jgi:hypothetical protein